MQDRVDKSMGIVTLITEALAKIKPTEPINGLTKHTLRKQTDKVIIDVTRSVHVT
jgi:hypothetical protein